MQTWITRAGRRPLGISIAALLALTTLAACSDEPVAPNHASTLSPKAGVRGLEPIDFWVTNTSGGTEVGSLRWAAEQVRGPSVIRFDPSLAGSTVTLDAGLELRGQVEIIAPAKGVTISGKDQFRIISSAGGVILTNVTITKGYADYGAALAVGWLEMYHSTVHGNRSPTSAIHATAGFALSNSTVSGNTVGRSAVEYGSEAYQARLDNTTIAYNAPGAGLGPDGRPMSSQQVWLANSIISNNGSPQQNCTSSFGFVYQGANISSDWSCGEVGIIVADPMLAPLANNGGPNMTHAISFTSPAYNAGIDCQWNDDQRYVIRDAKCDIGAFEFNDFTKVTITIDPNVKVDASSGKALLTGTLTCSRDGAFRLALEIHQDQKVGKNVVDVHGASDISVTCGTTPTQWRGVVRPTAPEAFQAGAAKAVASTYQTQDWVTPASTTASVKLVRK